MSDDSVDLLREFLAENGDATQEHLNTFDALLARAEKAEAEREATRAQFETLTLATIDNSARCDALATANKKIAAYLHGSATSFRQDKQPGLANMLDEWAEELKRAQSPAGRQLDQEKADV